jgi:hypothetical protein
MKISFEFWMSESDKNFSRKDAKHAKLGEDRKIFFFAPLATWRENLLASRCVQELKSNFPSSP